MDVNVQEIFGPWNLGYSLDKHIVSSVYTGDNQFGHPTFDTTRTPIGEALFRLKYRGARDQAALIADQMVTSLSGYFPGTSFVVPMPPSKLRAIQPVLEISRQLAQRMGIPCVEDFLVKTGRTPQMKDIALREDKVNALRGVLSINDVLPAGQHDVLLVDDLFDSGASVEAATEKLRSCAKIRNIFVGAVTRKR